MLGQFIFLTLELFLLLSCFALYQFYKIGYTPLIQTTLQNIQRPDLEQVITKRFFTYEKYAILQSITIPIIGICIILSILIIWKRKTIMQRLESLFNSFFIKTHNLISTIRNIKSAPKFLFFLLIIAAIIRGVYFASIFYIQFDEAFNYNYFLHKNIFYTIVAYNNYPLHNIISWLTMHIFSNSLLIQRMPSIVSGIIFILLCFYSIQKWYKNNWLSVAMCGIIFSLPVFIFYSLYARGVMINLVFAILLFYFIIEFSNHLNYKRVFVLSILNALALYSMLSHLYFILATGIFFLLYILIEQKYHQIKYMLLYTILSIGFSYSLLLPMQLGTGLDLGLSVATAKQVLSVQEIFQYPIQVSYFLVGYGHTFFVVLIFNCMFLFSSNLLNKKIALLNSIILLLALIIPAFTNVCPPERSLSFIVLPYIFTLTMGINSIIDKLKPIIVLSGISILCIVLQNCTIKHNYLNWSKPLDKSAAEVAQLFLSKNITTCYSNSSEFNYFAPALHYYFLHQHRSFEFKTSSLHSTRFIAVPNNTISCIVIDVTDQKMKEKLVDYTKIYAFHEFEIYNKE